jgi:glutaredoxin 3
MSHDVTLYTKDYCPFCKAAKALLAKKGVAFMNIEISDNEEERAEMIQRSDGRSTVPQIFIGGFHVGGFTDLQALDKSGGLDALLRQPSAA